MIEQEIASVIKVHTDIICNNVRNRWNSQSIQGNAEIHADFPKIVTPLVIATIEASGGKAWVSEYGRGSLMDDSGKNPYLNEYLRSPQFNQWRLHSSRMPIMGRSAGEYIDLDGGTHVSSGKMQGLDLERDGDPRFQPLKGQYVIHEEIIKEIPELILHIQKAVADYAISQLTMSLQIYL